MRRTQFGLEVKLREERNLFKMPRFNRPEAPYLEQSFYGKKRKKTGGGTPSGTYITSVDTVQDKRRYADILLR